MNMVGRLPVTALVVAANLFGVGPTGTKYALGGFGPVTVLLVELVAASAMLWMLVRKRGYRRPRSWRRVIVLGVLEPGIAYLLLSFGLRLTRASNAALLTGLESGFVVVLAAIFLRERAGWALIVAMLLALFGMVVLEGSGGFGAPGLGDVLVTAGSLSAAGYTVLARGLAPDEDPLTVTAHQFAVATALTLPLAVYRWSSGAEQLPIDIPPRFWIIAVLVGILGFGVSFTLYNSAISKIAAGPAAVVINLAPAFGLASAVWWLGEALTTARTVGAVLIGLSVLLFVGVERSHRLVPRLAGHDVPIGEPFIPMTKRPDPSVTRNPGNPRWAGRRADVAGRRGRVGPAARTSESR